MNSQADVDAFRVVSDFQNRAKSNLPDFQFISGLKVQSEMRMAGLFGLESQAGRHDEAQAVGWLIACQQPYGMVAVSAE